MVKVVFRKWEVVNLNFQKFIEHKICPFLNQEKGQELFSVSRELISNKCSLTNQFNLISIITCLTNLPGSLSWLIVIWEFIKSVVQMLLSHVGEFVESSFCFWSWTKIVWHFYFSHFWTFSVNIQYLWVTFLNISEILP